MFKKYVEVIDQTGITTALIEEIINDHALERERMIKNYGRYKQREDDTPIFERTFKVDAANEINHKLANDWLGEVVDTKTGYMFGTPVMYQLEKQAPEYQRVLETIERFKKVNHMDDLNSEFGKFAALQGYDGALLYIDKEGQTRIKRIDPWETCIIASGEITEPSYGLRYYQKFDNTWRVDFYNDVNRISYEGTSLNAVDLQEVDANPHMYGYCPLFGVPNNAELMGDADKVLSLIDAYDRTSSDHSNEIEQFRLSYMIFLGYAPTEDDLAKMRKNGALYIPDIDDGEDIKYLTKQMDVASIDSHLDRLEKNITRFAKHVNFTDEAFGGNLSGVAMRYKLFALEAKAKTMERKHEAAMLYMFKVLASAWEIEGIPLDYTMIDCKYNRNIAVDITTEATAANNLMGVVSKRTILEQLSFVNDVEAEMDRIESEKLDTVDLDEEITKPEVKIDPIGV